MFAKWIEADDRFSFSLTDNGGVAITDKEHAVLFAGQAKGMRIVADGNGFPVLADNPGPTAEQLTAQYRTAAQNLLENLAKSWGYDSAIYICSYSSSTAQQFRADAEAFLAYRDSLWIAANNIKISVSATGDPIPATEKEFLALLPVAPKKPVVQSN